MNNNDLDDILLSIILIVSALIIIKLIVTNIQ